MAEATKELQWDQTGERLYETGTDRGVMFPQTKDGKHGEGIAWNGLTSVKQSPDGAEPTDLFADNMKYLSMTSAENFKGSIEAYTYPEEFAACDGSAQAAPGVYLGQQNRTPFALSYRTLVGNDVQGTDLGYKIHIIWGAKVAPSERAYETVNADPNAITFSWEFSTTPQQVKGYKATSYVCIDSTKVSKEVLDKVEDMLYGTKDAGPKLPSVQEVIDLVGNSEGNGKEAGK